MEYPNKRRGFLIPPRCKTGTYPLLLQYDPRWGYAFYGDDVIAVNDISTCLSMVIAGLTGKNTITPYTTASSPRSKGICPRFGHQLVSDERWCIPFRHYREELTLSISTETPCHLDSQIFVVCVPVILQQLGISLLIRDSRMENLS